MSTLPQEHDVSKLLVMTDNVVIRNQAYERSRFKGAKASNPEYGKLKASINELQVTAEKVRKGSAQP
jgi:hypothetical protein